ncbi:MAG: ABC transporter [Chloroflexi bacterium CG07_land_8_20_14_0_80_51_10]|nr:MAG: ABC transporter [Chloroflexi bacterium CG07_land_8_20_14_0_80_51_10]
MIRIKNLCVDLGDFVLRDASLDVQQGEYFIILGPTGAGKTVLLETIAGLYSAKSGEVWLNGQDVTKLEPEKRGVGFVYQDHVLFPHLAVHDNIAFGLKHRRKSKSEIENAANWAVELLGISHLLKRKPDTLSGGEKQKVALARALVVQPEVLLLDEPLSALDPETKESVQRELRAIHDRLNLTIIHVTHDFEEAIALGDRIAVIGEGRIVQVGTPEEIFRQPNSEFVARFAMTRNIFAGEVRDGGGECALIDIGGTQLAVVTDLRGNLHASIRPEDILLSAEALRSSARNSFKGVITNISNRGSTVYLTVTVPPDFICLVTRRSFEELELKEGGEVYVTFKASAVHVF